MIIDAEYLFMCPLTICISSSQKMSIRSFTHLLIKLFVLVILNNIKFLYFLDINSLSDMLFVNIFSHSVRGLFILLIVPFAMKNIFCLMYSHFFNFSFCFPCLRKHPRLMSKIYFLFSFRSFIVSSLTFKSHFFLNLFLCIMGERGPV